MINKKTSILTLFLLLPFIACQENIHAKAKTWTHGMNKELEENKRTILITIFTKFGVDNWKLEYMDDKTDVDLTKVAELFPEDFDLTLGQLTTQRKSKQDYRDYLALSMATAAYKTLLKVKIMYKLLSATKRNIEEMSNAEIARRTKISNEAKKIKRLPTTGLDLKARVQAVINAKTEQKLNEKLEISCKKLSHN